MSDTSSQRKHYEYIGRTVFALGNKISALEADNAKLRKLATGLYRCWLGEGCDGCPMQESDGWCIRDLQLRELGVEVEQ